MKDITSPETITEIVLETSSNSLENTDGSFGFWNRFEVEEVTFTYDTGYGLETVGRPIKHWFADIHRSKDRPERFWDKYVEDER